VTLRGPALAAGLLSLALLAGCHGFEPTVKRTMSWDLRCPEEKIKVTSLPAGGYQAEGCGQAALYDCSWPEGGTRSCTRRGAPAAKTLPGTGF